jgi:hypothetical protein
LKRALSHAPAPDGDMLVTVIEFEGRPEEAILGTLGFRVSLIAYPIVALRKVGSRGFWGGGGWGWAEACFGAS